MAAGPAPAAPVAPVPPTAQPGVTLTASAAAVAAGPRPEPPGTKHAGAEVTYKHEGDRIAQIQIRCSCGETIVLDCDYSGEGAA